METERFEEIDFIRGLAVLLMIAYHAIFDLYIFGLLDLRIGALPLEVFADVTAGTFFSVVGISLYISFSRTKVEGHSAKFRLKKYLARGLKLLGWGAIVTAVTYFLFPDMVILFGALHFIGVSVMLGYCVLELTNGWRRFFRLTFLASMVIAIFLISEQVCRGLQINNPFLLWLGIAPPEFQSLDYFPLFPWFGLVVAGFVMGELFYPGGGRRIEVLNVQNRGLEFLGRNSLIIYFVHQPVLYVAIIITRILAGKGFSGVF